MYVCNYGFQDLDEPKDLEKPKVLCKRKEPEPDTSQPKKHRKNDVHISGEGKVLGAGEDTGEEYAGEDVSFSLFSVDIEASKQKLTKAATKQSFTFPFAVITKINTLASRGLGSNGFLLGVERHARKADVKKGVPAAVIAHMLYVPADQDNFIANLTGPASEDMLSWGAENSDKDEKVKVVGVVRVPTKETVAPTLADGHMMQELQKSVPNAALVLAAESHVDASSQGKPIYRLTDAGMDAFSSGEGPVRMTPEMFCRVEVSAGLRGAGARLMMRIQGQVDPWDTLHSTINTAYSKQRSGELDSCASSTPAAPLLGTMVANQIPHIPTKLVTDFKDEFMKLLKGGKILRVGTDCSGIDAPIIGLNYISGALKQEGLDLHIRHRFSCDNNPQCQKFAVTWCNPDHVFGDMLARTWRNSLQGRLQDLRRSAVGSTAMACLTTPASWYGTSTALA